MAAGTASSTSRSLAAATCLLALLFAACLAAALPGADARRLLATAMPPASPGMAPAPTPGADYASGRLLLEGGRELLDGGLRLAGRLLLGLGL
ncbi:hypothetical protein SEVIR_9G168800v4 [Setaria viridis]|uniref:Uncharacterized protein n=1 Tax=Setaria viridis TaxID=4556 RepID=A0A4U6SVR3_SETVI|nr:hypothetical protein SEVIR_9G168800v2 [Setaria viridis]